MEESWLARRTQSVVRVPRRASIAASAVPHAPAPRTAMATFDGMVSNDRVQDAIERLEFPEGIEQFRAIEM